MALKLALKNQLGQGDFGKKHILWQGKLLCGFIEARQVEKIKIMYNTNI